MRLNDAHCHFFSRRFFETLARDDLQGRFTESPVERICTTLEWDAPGSPTELATKWVSTLDHHGVSRAALIASVPGDDVSVVEAVRHAPDRFVGFFMVNPLADPGRVWPAAGPLEHPDRDGPSHLEHAVADQAVLAVDQGQPLAVVERGRRRAHLAPIQPRMTAGQDRELSLLELVAPGGGQPSSSVHT